MGVSLPDRSAKLKLLLALIGVDMAGESALRKSMYALGGVMGVFSSSSLLTTSSMADAVSGLRGSSEGNMADGDLGTFSIGRLGLVEGEEDFEVAVEAQLSVGVTDPEVSEGDAGVICTGLQVAEIAAMLER